VVIRKPGGYDDGRRFDVLAKPFDVVELTRSLRLAWLHGQGQGSGTRPKVMVAGAAPKW